MCDRQREIESVFRMLGLLGETDRRRFEPSNAESLVESPTETSSTTHDPQRGDDAQLEYATERG